METPKLPLIKFGAQYIFSSIIVWGVSLILLAGCASEPADPSAQPDAATTDEVQTYRGIGVVKTITPTKNYINIDHEAITGFMGAMAMFFPVPDTSVLNNIAVEDSIAFTIEVKAGKPGILEISVIE